MDRIKLYYELEEKVRELAEYVGVSDEQLQEYYAPESDKNYLFKLASSLQNSGRMSNSIKFNDKKVENARYRKAISEALSGFQAKDAWENYKDKTGEAIRTTIKEQGIDTEAKPKKELHEGDKQKNYKSNWQKYCNGLFCGLDYLVNGRKDEPSKTGEEEIRELAAYDDAVLSDDIIVKIFAIQSKIYGLGFSLTCDWLKECGCTWLAKPDVHIKAVIASIMETDNISDTETLKYIFDWAKKIGKPDVTAYKIDRIIWLLCTGNFYLNDKTVGRNTVLDCIDRHR